MGTKHNLRRIVIISVIGMLGLTACTTVDPYTREEKTSKATWGAGIGAALGGMRPIVEIMTVIGIIILLLAILLPVGFVGLSVLPQLSPQSLYLVQSILGALLAPLTAIVPAVVYHDLRVGKRIALTLEGERDAVEAHLVVEMALQERACNR